MCTPISSTIRRLTPIIALAGLCACPLLGYSDGGQAQGSPSPTDPEAQFQFGKDYQIGKGVKQDYAEAAKWYPLPG